MAWNYTGWGQRDAKEHTVALIAEGDTAIATFPAQLEGITQVEVQGTPWKLSQGQRSITAEVGQRTFKAGVAKKFSSAKEIELDLAGRSARAICEKRSDWVYEDASGEKLGQFSGGNNGVRHSYTEFEAGKTSEEEQVFLSLVSRTVLESKLSSMSIALIGSLVLISLFLVLVFL
ncbi:hypothetical protein [Corynebacterium pelargi]|uniref:Uncharacterized protein n=1 Tax=Corynebacterium pelargi TaxID=1471400 RepID=A0A410W7C6_9CORY|nr:hypothetical protein [Corynebacterium pelargi]QAU51911.1 hypothetical protein CPELA_03140 [Corynebacterium pelargi]GGG71510.1 hypothetical protein GCM10007338_05680 [Corynebacterium pelargi]